MRKEVIEVYKRYGIDPKKAIETLKSVPLSIQCWQLDDIDGFLKKESLSGGIASTGNYPFKARGFDELVKDYKFALDLIPGKKRSIYMQFMNPMNQSIEVRFHIKTSQNG